MEECTSIPLPLLCVMIFPCAQLTHLHIQAPARITLKPLSNYFPCFSKIVFSLMSSVSSPRDS